jgi:DNA-binding NarL/FixJ family response regulator
VNALEMIWRDLKNWLQRKRLFAMDVEAYETLRRVAEREQRPPEEVAASLFEEAAQQQASQAWVLACWEQLSPRQRQVAAYVCRGDTTRQIASQLQIAPTTVKSHIEIVLRKFGVNSRVALRQILAPWDLSSYL